MTAPGWADDAWQRAYDVGASCADGHFLDEAAATELARLCVSREEYQAMVAELEVLRSREVQALGAGISLRSWHGVEVAYNEGRDRLDRVLMSARAALKDQSKEAGDAE